MTNLLREAGLLSIPEEHLEDEAVLEALAIAAYRRYAIGQPPTSIEWATALPVERDAWVEGSRRWEAERGAIWFGALVDAADAILGTSDDEHDRRALSAAVDRVVGRQSADGVINEAISETSIKGLRAAARAQAGLAP